MRVKLEPLALAGLKLSMDSQSKKKKISHPDEFVCRINKSKNAHNFHKGLLDQF